MSIPNVTCTYANLANVTYTEGFMSSNGSNFSINCSNTTNTTDTDNSGLSIVTSFEEKLAIYICYSLVFALGTLGNGAIIYLVGVTTQNLSTSELLMTSLAVADFLASFFIPVVMIYDLATDYNWGLGPFLCKILPSVNVFTIVASAWHLVIISLDRCRVIVRPFDARVLPHKIAIVLTVVWLFALSATYPYMHMLKLNDSGLGCWDTWPSPSDITHFAYFSVIIAIICPIPTTIMTAAYTVAAVMLAGRRTVHKNSTAAMAQRRSIQNRKITWMFSLVVAMFFLMTTPYLLNLFVIVYWKAFDTTSYDKNFQLLQRLNSGLFVLATFNSCSNAIIYARMHSGIRRRIRRAVGIRTPRASLQQPTLTVTPSFFHRARNSGRVSHTTSSDVTPKASPHLRTASVNKNFDNTAV